MQIKIYSNLDELSQVRHLVYGLNPLLGWLEESEYSYDHFLDCAGIPRTAIEDPDYLISPSQELTFHTAVCLELDIPHLGLIIGPRYHLSSYGMLGLAAMTAENLYECYRRFFDHIVMTWTYFRFGMVAEGGDGILDMEALRDLGNAYRYMADRDISAAYTIASEALGFRLPLRSVELHHKPPRYSHKYEEFFECPVHFGKDRNALVFDRKWFEEPLEKSEPATSKVFAAQCGRISESLCARYNLSEHIRALVMNWGHPPKSLVEIASALHTTPRSIQRRLSAEGTSFNDLVRQVRLNVALEFLRTTSLSIEQIGHHLGFSNSSSFSHAFKSWHGLSPSSVRQAATEANLS